MPSDPVTRTNGTTTTLFASMCIRPADIVDPPHRHTAAAVNYFMEGRGGARWAAATSSGRAATWSSSHHHGRSTTTSGDQPVYQLAVQDNPLHLAMGSLMWQEDLGDRPLLGGEPGFTTNRHQVESTAPAS